MIVSGASAPLATTTAPGVVEIGGGLQVDGTGRASALATGGRGVDTATAISRQTGRQHLTAPWYPDTQRLQREVDTLFLPLVQNEADVLAQGGRLSNVFQSYFAAGTNRAVLVAGRDPQGLSFDQTTLATGYALFPLTGCLPTDQFTVELPLLSIGADYTAQPYSAVQYFWSASTSIGSNNEFYLGRSAAGVLHASLFIDATATPSETGVVNLGCDLVLSAGDIPADTWVTLSLVWTGTQLKLYLGNNTKTATGGSGAPVFGYPMASSSATQFAGIAINAGAHNGALTANFRVGPPHIKRYARTPATVLLRKGPTLVVDAGTTQGAFPSDVGGVFAQYPGWLDHAADGSSGGGGLTATSIRDQLLSIQTADGLRLVRIDHVFDKIGVTGTNPNYVYNWANLDGPMDAMAAKGCRFHITLGYTPSLLGATPATPPTSSAGFAQMCADAWAHWVAKGYTVSSLSLWNEPGGASFWSGTQNQFTTLWGVVQAKLASIAGCPALGTCEDVWSSTGYVKAVIDYASTNSLPLDCVYLHDYGGSLATLRQVTRDVRAYLTTKGFSGSTLPLAVTEWNFDQAILGQYMASLASLAKGDNVAYGNKMAAYMAAFLCEMVAASVKRATFTRLGILDATNYGSTAVERLEGLFTNDDPPRALPAYGALALFWKLGGTKVSALSNWPSVRALASIQSGVITLYYSVYREWADSEDLALSFEWAGLPATFRWQHWQVDRTTTADGRLVQVGSGDQRTLPLGATIGVLGCGCIQITPS